jgi:predicted enzyme related to lactoylglutathione lyase
MIGAVTIDTVDAEGLATWWADLLGVEMRPLDHPATYVVVPPQESGGIQLGFQKVPERKQGKVRIHLDLITFDLDEAQRDIEERGGMFLAEHGWEDKWRWRVMADPEGNEFCIVAVKPAESGE